VQVKLLAEDSGLYVDAESVDRVSKERAMRKRQMKWLWKRLHELIVMQVSREDARLTARSALEKFAAVQMIDVHLPTFRRNPPGAGAMRRQPRCVERAHGTTDHPTDRATVGHHPSRRVSLTSACQPLANPDEATVACLGFGPPTRVAGRPARLISRRRPLVARASAIWKAVATAS
jgi:hypothetical protein